MNSSKSKGLPVSSPAAPGRSFRVPIVYGFDAYPPAAYDFPDLAYYDQPKGKAKYKAKIANQGGQKWARNRK